MCANRLTRKELFRQALAEAGMSRRAWAHAQNLTDDHVRFVLSGSRVSARLCAKIDAFIARHPSPTARSTRIVAWARRVERAG